MAAEVHSYDPNEKFEFSAKLKKNILIIGIIGLVFLAIGIFTAMSGGGHGAEEHAQLLDEVAKSSNTALAGGGEHGAFDWTKRLKANLWLNIVFFTGVSLVGVFFFAIQYVAMAGWSVAFLRVYKSLGAFLPVGAVLMIGVFFWANHDLFHWTHDYLYDKSGADYDHIIAGKEPFFFAPLDASGHFPVFFLVRMLIFLGGWIIFSMVMNKHHYAEDLEGGTKRYRKLVGISAGFIVFFGLSSSISAWDWILSIDTHWFSTMFGWYVFASWFVGGLALMTFIICVLKDAGYLKLVNENHLHDMGKFVFAFSIFWTYIWLSQFLLIYYANIPEETVYFLERLFSDHYGKFIGVNLFLNFFFPFLALMTRDAKRKMAILKIVCAIVVIGHWSDFYLMVMPGTVKEYGTLGFMEIGMAMVFLAGFAFVVFNELAKRPLIAKNHPMIEECVHHTT